MDTQLRVMYFVVGFLVALALVVALVVVVLAATGAGGLEFFEDGSWKIGGCVSGWLCQ